MTRPRTLNLNLPSELDSSGAPFHLTLRSRPSPPPFAEADGRLGLGDLPLQISHLSLHGLHLRFELLHVLRFGLSAPGDGQ